MITRQTLSEIMSFSPEHYLTTTLYLTIDGLPVPTYPIAIKDLIKHKRKVLDEQSLTPAARKSVNSDLKKIADYVRLKFERNGARTLVIFSCAAKKFWSVLTLALPLRDQLDVGPRPNVRPLISFLDEYHRFLVILVERSKARLFEVYAGEIHEYIDVFDVVPGRVRIGGYDERRIERHIEDHVRRHFKHVADVGFELSKRSVHDSVVLLGSEQNTSEFHYYLHTSLHSRIVGREVAEINAPPQDILQRVMQIEKKMKEDEDRKLLNRLLNEVRSGGLGVVGLDSTIRALHQGQVNALVVEDGFAKAGFRCKDCASLSTHNGTCDYCGGPLQSDQNIVEDTVLEALKQGCQVKFLVLPESELSSAGRIGAILRFKAQDSTR